MFSMATSLKIRIIAFITACILIFGIGVGYAFLHSDGTSKSLPILNMAGQEITISEYRDAADPDFNTLIMFLSEDATEDKDYVYPVYTCGDFASRLHDSAEKRGIRCGIVGVKFKTAYEENRSEILNNGSHYLPAYSSYDACRGHAFNAFNTTDRGIVYVDSTGITVEEKEMGNKPYDMIVYAREGEELGEIRVDQVESLDYSYYKLKEGQYLRYRSTVEKYNYAAEILNREIRENNISASTAINKKRELEAMRLNLEQREEYKWIIVGQLGVIDHLQVFW
ncbi:MULTISPECIES: hypothetical protein [Methanosarcina]|nr:hypothetical protein [Methanosarcina mazei]BBL64202.1 hypothetical protein MmazTMA_11790 [Methanosarcina mazei]